MANFRPSRWILFLLMTLLPMGRAMVPAPILGADHIDGATTFCYDDHDLIIRLSSAAKFPWHGTDCPIELAVQAACSNDNTSTTKCQAKQTLAFTLTATTQFARPNAFNLPRLEATTKNALNHSVQTNSAVVYGCDNGAICDLVDNSTTATPTFSGEDGSGNFTNGKAVFTQSFEFATPGNKVVVGYLELPPSLSTHNQTLHFVVFLSLQVIPGADNEEALAPATKTKGSSSSNGMLYGILGGIIGVLLVAGIAFFVVRNRRSQKQEDGEHATLTGKATIELPQSNFDGSGASTLPANSLAHEFPPGPDPVVSPRSRDVLDDMTFQLPEERFSMDSEGSMGTGQTLAYVGIAPTPTTLPVPAPHGAKYEVLDGSAYYAPPPSGEDSSAANDTVFLPSLRSNLDSQQSYGTDDDSGVDGDGHSMSTIELPSPQAAV